MDEPIKPAIKPKCGRCYREVDSATSQAVMVRNIPGQHLVYECHGEKAEYDVEKVFYEMLLESKTPFMSSVFKPAVVTSVPKEQVAKEDAILAMREQRKVVADFIESTIKSVVESQPTYKTTDLALWCQTCSVRLESLYADVVDHARDVRRLVMGTNTVLGIFELPFFPDDTLMTWTPTPVTEKKGKR